MELPVTVPVLLCTLTVMARSHEAADPPTIVFLVSVRLSREDFSFPRGVQKGRFCGEVYVGDRVQVRLKGHRDDQEDGKRTRAVPCGGGNAPPCSPTRFDRHAFDRGESHLLTVGRGKCSGCVYVFISELLSCVYVFMSELFSVGTTRRDVRRRFRGGALRALPDAG